MTLRSICAETFRHQLTEENMRIFRMAFVSGFVGALMAGNVATLHAAPLPTNVASMKSSRQFDPGPVGRLARRGGHKCAACLEGGTAPRRPLTNIGSGSEGFRYLRTGYLPGKPLDG